MSEEHGHEHEHAAARQAVFRFEAFADAPSAQAAFEARYPRGSPVEPAVQALVDMGAHCKAVSPMRIACRYVESEHALAGWCWHVALEGNHEKTIQRVSVALAALGI
jgi:hypothetical protein